MRAATLSHIVTRLAMPEPEGGWHLSQKEVGIFIAKDTIELGGNLVPPVIK